MTRIYTTLAIILIILSLTTVAEAQYTTVTATVTDPNSAPYVQGTVGASLIPPAGATELLRFIGTPQGSPPVPGSVAGALDASGSFTLSLADNNLLTPAGSQWRFTVCSRNRVVCFVYQGTITGASQSLSSALSALAPVIPASVVSGLTSLNGLTGATQTFAIGTSGSDFNISSASTTHTFNLPTASATNRGLLSSADWTTFNAKESPLTFNSPLSRNSNVISCLTASATQTGCLSSTDWSTFNNKFSSPLTTRGDLLTRDASTHIRLGIGSNGTFLASNGTDPGWRTIVAADIPVLDTSKVTSGTFGTARLGGGTADSTTFLRGDSTWQTIMASNITSGTMATARLGSGTADATTFLRGDSTWSVLPSGVAAGSDTQVQFNDSGLLGGDSGLTYNKTTNVLTGTAGGIVQTQGTLTSSVIPYDHTATWNNSGVTFSVFKTRSTVTAANSTSTLIDLQSNTGGGFGADGLFRVFQSGGIDHYITSAIEEGYFLKHTWSNASTVYSGLYVQVPGSGSFAAGSSMFLLEKTSTSATWKVSPTMGITATQGTITASSPALSHTATWNSGATTFSNISSDITDTASSASSKLIDLKIGGATKFSVQKDGTGVLAGSLTVQGSGGIDTTDLDASGSTTVASLAIGSGTTITKHISAMATLDFGNLAAIGCEDLTITVTGAALGDTVSLGVPNGSVPSATSTFFGWVSAADTVTVRYCTLVSGNPASGTFRADVWKH